MSGSSRDHVRLTSQPLPSVVVTDAPYRFVPPHRGAMWPKVLNLLTPSVLRRRHGVTRIEVRGEQTLQSLIASGHRILITPNHTRMADPVVLLQAARRLRRSLFIMASSHLFRGNRVSAFTMRRLGAFSVFREGVDRDAVRTAVDLLVQGERPLVIFPEGALSQANDRLNTLMDGVSIIARTAQRKLEQQQITNPLQRADQQRVILLPVAIRYLFQGDLDATVAPVLAHIEHQLTWDAQHQRPLVDRILRIGSALLSLKEIDYLGSPQTGTLQERQDRLIALILTPIEAEWLRESPANTVISRVRELRKLIVPDMIGNQLPREEIDRRWRQLNDLDLVQAISLFPPNYVTSRPTVDRILETVERFAENLTGQERAYPPLHAVVRIGQPIDVPGRRDREGESLTTKIADQLRTMLAELATESRLYV